MMSAHFSYDKVIKSKTAAKHNIDNTLPSIYYKNAIELANLVLEPIHKEFDTPFSPLSWYRCEKLNKLVGGSKNSDHLFARAADIVVPGVSIDTLFDFIRKNLIFKQVILEPRWVHVSFDKKNNLGQTLRMAIIDGKKTYFPA